jgi:peptide/nickel transport system substrate-binding protein
MPSMTVPTSWAFDHTLPPIAYDVEQANRLLEAADWIDNDANPDTPRIAHGARYAPDGMPFSFVLSTNTGGRRRESVAAIIQAQLKQVGIAVDVQAIDFAALSDRLAQQTFDAALFGWSNSYPDNPDQTQLFTTGADVIGSGSNNTSYHNPELDSLMEQARTLPGCDTQARALIYNQIQVILQRDLPYILNELYAARTTVSGFAPYPNQLYWNVATWNVTAP